MNSLQPLYRYGFLREFQTKHVDAVDSRGRIDIERSLQNKTKGIPKQHYVQRIANYDIPVNRLIYRAGQHLIQLFQKSAGEHSQKEYYRLFSELNDAVQDIRLIDIGSKSDPVFAYKNITIKQLPRQRRYYAEAMYVSKMILSSTTGKSLESAQERLSVDYLFNMSSLFEEFSQVVLEEELNNIQSRIDSDAFNDIQVRSKPTIQPYKNNPRVRHQPDHVLYKGRDALSVMDSKYYEKDRDPSLSRSLRSQMFSYAFLLETTNMAFLVPEGIEHHRELSERNGNVNVVTSQNGFTTHEYRKSIRSYLLAVLDDCSEEELNKDLITRSEATHPDEQAGEPVNKQSEKQNLVADIRDKGICFEGVNINSIEQVPSEKQLNATKYVKFAKRVREEALLRSSVNERQVKDSTLKSIRKQISKMLNEHSKNDRCVPVFYQIRAKISLTSATEELKPIKKEISFACIFYS